MKKIKLLLIASLISASLYAQDNKLYSFYDNEYGEIEAYAGGYKDVNGKIVIPKGKYVFVWSPVFDKIAFVGIKGRSGIYAIDRNENVLFEVYICDNGPDYVKNGLFRIRENGKVGFANMNGDIVIKPTVDMAFPLQDNGLIIFCIGGHKEQFNSEYSIWEGGKWGAMDRTGKIVIPAIYEDYNKNMLKKGDKWYEITDAWKLELKE